MSAKNKDKNGRWRSKTVAFRMSPEENKALEEAVALSGLTKQDYIISKVLNREVTVIGNPRVFSALKNKMSEIHSELTRINTPDEVSDRLLETIDLVSRIYGDMF